MILNVDKSLKIPKMYKYNSTQGWLSKALTLLINSPFLEREMQPF